MIDRELLDILACPKCKSNLRLSANKNVLICDSCRVFYEIKDGIPVLLIDSGKPIEEDSSSVKKDQK